MTTVYRLYNVQSELLYVGIAEHWPTRMKQHSRDKAWWPDVASVRLEEHLTRAVAESTEAAVIRSESPRWNIMHNSPVRKVTGNTPTTWKCEICGDGAMYLQTDRYEEWHCVCRRHDELGDSARYWIEVTRIKTKDDVAKWEEHLRHKNWFDVSGWRDVVKRCGGNLRKSSAAG